VRFISMIRSIVRAWFTLVIEGRGEIYERGTYQGWFTSTFFAGGWGVPGRSSGKQI
jgi:hypothetical protein